MSLRYLEKQTNGLALIGTPPNSELDMVVVIPCYDEPDVTACLASLQNSWQPGSGREEILIIINYPESASKDLVLRSEQLREQIDRFSRKGDAGLPIHCHTAVFPDAKAGVGRARKTGMDEAVRRFELIGTDGIIVNLDADCIVSNGYFEAIRKFYRSHPSIWAAGIHFEHRLDPDCTDSQREAIIDYELHLRYFIQAQRFLRLPFAYQTVGSCMTVRSSAYQRMGGMNSRQAGEDFYFLHKFIDVRRFGEINDATVFPSARASHRVPFGTGKAILARMAGEEQKTYHWHSFKMLEGLLDSLPALYRSDDVQQWIQQLPMLPKTFLLSHGGVTKLAELKRETSRSETFYSRFFQWFNAFRLMKYLHAVRDHFPDQPVLGQALELMSLIRPGYCYTSKEDLLQEYRMAARKFESGETSYHRKI